MKYLCLFLSAALLAGCASPRQGQSRYDAYDSVKIDQMVGNHVSQAVFQKVLVCVNARRETRQVTALTNVTISTVTNSTVVPSTNVTISIATNLLITAMTNIAPPLPSFSGGPVGEAADAAAVAATALETNTLVVVTNPGPTFSTNVTVSLASNASATKAPNQSAANAQQVRTVSSQITTTSNNVSVSVMTNYIVTAETNQVVSYATNVLLSSVTNVAITPTNGLVFDYFLYTELTPPPDFTLAPGESLVLLVDGVRYGFAQSQSGTAFVGRRGFTSGLYRVPPEVLVAIANAKEAKIRFKGVSSVIERTMNHGSKQHFRDFLVKYFTPEPEPSATKARAATSEKTTRVANR